MKKSSVVNLSIVSCLLALCITTLIVIYATAPETSVVLFEDNFNALDESKWTHEAAECQEDSESLYYAATNNENRFLADGTLHVFTTHAKDEEKSKREAQSKCSSCINWQNGAVDCFSSKYSARLRTKAAFHAKCGELEVRFRFPSDHWIKLTVSITPAKNESETEETSGGFVISKGNDETSTNCSIDIQVFFGANSSQSVIKRAVADDDFHSYKVKWDDSKILFTLDEQIVFEKVFQMQGNISCSDEEPDRNAEVDQPFHIRMRVDMGGDDLKCHDNQHSDSKRSLTRSADSSILDVDRIRFSKLLG